MENCLDYRQLQEALASLSDTLDETYARILNAVPSRHKQMAIRILQFLAFFERPLRIEEVVEVIAVDPKGDPRFDSRSRMPEPKEILRYCSSLMAVERRRTSEYGQTMVTELQLSYFSVKEYLTSNRLEKDLMPSFQEISAKASIATICLAYLLQLDGKLPVLEIRKNFPLAQYCARYWMSHAAVTEGGDAVVQGFIEELFSHCERPYTSTTATRPLATEQHQNPGGPAEVEEQEWEITEILEKRAAGLETEYRVRWEDTWLLSSELGSAQGLLEKFEAQGRAQHGRKRGRPARTDKGW